MTLTEIAEKYPRNRVGRLLESLITVAVADLVALIGKFIFSLLTLPISSELTARGAEETLTVLDNVRAIFCVGVFGAALLVATLKNPHRRSRYVNESYPIGYRLASDLKGIVCCRFLWDAIAGFALALPLTVVLMVFGEIDYLPTVFAPVDALWELTGSPIAALLTTTLLVPTLVCVGLLIAHFVWDRSRLHR